MSNLHPALSFRGFRSVQCDYGLTALQFAAYMAIALATDGKTGITPPISYATLAKRANISRSHAYNCAKKLRGMGLITWTSTGTGNKYLLQWGVSQGATLHGENALDNAGGVSPQTIPDVSVVLHDTPVSPQTTLTPPSVSPQTTPIYKDKDKGSIQDKEVQPAPDDVLKRYQSCIGDLTNGLRLQLARLCHEYPPAWVKEALTITEDNHKNSLRYTEGVLKGFVKDGKPLPGAPKPRKPDTVGTPPYVPTPEELVEIRRILREEKPDFKALAKAGRA